MIDEAAAIPLPIVKEMLGPYLVFLCSTVNGYEGTGKARGTGTWTVGSKVLQGVGVGPYLVFLCSTVNSYEGTGELIKRRRKGKGEERGQWRVSEVTEGQPRGRGGAPHTTYHPCMRDIPCSSSTLYHIEGV